MDNVRAGPRACPPSRVVPPSDPNRGRPRGAALTKVFIGLGSNMGNRKHNILRAVEMLSRTKGIEVSVLSTLVETKPVGPLPNQPDFLNAVIEIETALSPIELLDALLSIEARLGRVRAERWGPRTIDLDILLYGNKTIKHPRLTIPHPEIQNRPFVQAGLRELSAHG